MAGRDGHSADLGAGTETARPVVVAVELGPAADALAGVDGLTIVKVDPAKPGPVDGPSPEVLFAIPSPRVAGLAPWIDAVGWVHLASAGSDRYPRELFDGRVVTCSRGVHAPQMAEWVVHALLSDLKGGGQWVTEPPTAWGLGSYPKRLGDQTVGLIGLGGIGLRIAERLLPFGTQVLALRRSGAPSPLPGVEVVAGVKDLFAQADAVVIAAPATPDTRHIVDAAALAAAKPGLHLLNVARGSLLDHDALRAALDGGWVRLASLDVTDPEPPPAGHWLYRHPQVRVSPHVSWAAPPVFGELTGRFVENLARWRRGEPLEGIVDPARGY